MDIFEICKTLKSLEANEDEILGSLENLKRLLEEKYSYKHGCFVF